MEGFTLVDAVVAIIIIVSSILAYSRGFMREALAIGGWVAAAILAYIFAPQVEPLIKEIPVLNDFLADSCELSIITAFAAVFALALVVVSIFTPLFANVVKHSALGGIDQGLGFLFGVLRGVILIAVAFVVYDRVVTEDSVPMVDDSRSAMIFDRLQVTIEEQIPEDAPGWVVTKYEDLVGACIVPADPATPAPETPPTTEQSN